LVNPYSVIVLSQKPENVKACVDSIRARAETCRIIVVAGGIKGADRGVFPGVEWIDGAQPFCYARNANLGISSAGGDDVILCNDDARLITPGGFGKLREASKNFGVVLVSI
jgi:GT2 family glycosyltransferase